MEAILQEIANYILENQEYKAMSLWWSLTDQEREQNALKLKSRLKFPNEFSRIFGRTTPVSAATKRLEVQKKFDKLLADYPLLYKASIEEIVTNMINSTLAFPYPLLLTELNKQIKVYLLPGTIRKNFFTHIFEHLKTVFEPLGYRLTFDQDHTILFELE